ncbi:hypothetical protein Cni_G27522 [Canna indica]|uniref:Uncharacterized protein n=1 Tax=Canna indica TaxID=4628 RepID=A0AAQ3L1V9_9LILI|nr:hypothetical protein Cni_G27522 [Canna indica]
MEANGKRRGFKGKFIMSFYKSPKLSSVQACSKFLQPTPSSSSMEFASRNDQLLSPATVKASAVKGSEEHSIDKKAAAYISSVQRRFKLASSTVLFPLAKWLFNIMNSTGTDSTIYNSHVKK